MFRDFIIGSCTLSIAGMSLNTYLNHGQNFPTLVSIVLALVATSLSFSAIVRHRWAPAVK